ncbi:hypothetical protein AMS68_000526 [Peltaster fructicola]|uniref:EthD domain-containing protein n=1 Tax=Peltaster fructicola TaxID=286661 RepID=A0A6H0XK46_9PEZI|nr:hypothetical protein AMS68_000526 [Peltaster fructicola]
MPLATLHLISLSAGHTVSDYLRAISSSGVKPLVAARVVRWIIKPEKLSVNALLTPSWDLLIILPATSKLPGVYGGKDWIQNHWSMNAGIPSRVTNGFEQKNDRLLHPQQGDVPKLTGSMDEPRMADSAQGLELNTELLDWSKGFTLGQTGAVSMLNLLAFKPEKGADESYRRYGKAFSETIGARRGGDAKLVGKVVPKQGTSDEDNAGWEEFALAHYPSIRHFVDMLASKDYQEVNHRDRLPSLRDTCILCTSELDPELYAGKSRL